MEILYSKNHHHTKDSLYSFLFVIYSILVIYHYLVQIDNNNYNNIIEKQTSTTTSEKSTELLNEQDISSYTAFTLDKLYSPESYIYKRNKIKLKGLKQKNLHLIIQNGLNHLNHGLWAQAQGFKLFR